MKYTQFCSFEISDVCNRGREHTACPNMHPDRWKFSAGKRPMTDDQIIAVAEAMHAGGFTGCFAWHHYCEPLTRWPRLRDVIARIRVRVPSARFLLWTNGDLIPDDLSEFVGVFEQAMITNYAGRDLSRLSAVFPTIHHIPTTLDWRLNPPTHFGREPHCIRPYLEIVFDYYGNVRTCCMDWTGETSIGNIHDTPFQELWKMWLVRRDELAATPMAETAPRRCLACGTRYIHLAHYVPEIAARTLEHIR